MAEFINEVLIISASGESFGLLCFYNVWTLLPFLSADTQTGTKKIKYGSI